jgi:hypothetical protein
MGCTKEEENITSGSRHFWKNYTDEEKEMRLCQKNGDGNPFSTEYRIKPEKLEYDREFFDSRTDAQEIFL